MHTSFRSSPLLQALGKSAVFILQLALTSAEEAEKVIQTMNETLNFNPNNNLLDDFNRTTYDHFNNNNNNGSLVESTENWQLPSTVGANLTKDEKIHSQSWKATHRASSYAFIITMLSITVIMATIFTLFGLFMKAEAHSDDHHDHHGAERGVGGFTGGIMGHEDSGGFMKGVNSDID